jgi:hypothetical protein
MCVLQLPCWHRVGTVLAPCWHCVGSSGKDWGGGREGWSALDNLCRCCRYHQQTLTAGTTSTRRLQPADASTSAGAVSNRFLHFNQQTQRPFCCTSERQAVTASAASSCCGWYHQQTLTAGTTSIRCLPPADAGTTATAGTTSKRYRQLNQQRRNAGTTSKHLLRVPPAGAAAGTTSKYCSNRRNHQQPPTAR